MTSEDTKWDRETIAMRAARDYADQFHFARGAGEDAEAYESDYQRAKAEILAALEASAVSSPSRAVLIEAIAPHVYDGSMGGVGGEEIIEIAEEIADAVLSAMSTPPTIPCGLCGVDVAHVEAPATPHAPATPPTITDDMRAEIIEGLSRQLEPPYPAARFRWAAPARSWLKHRAADLHPGGETNGN